jgi:hypothetical protein
MCRDYPRNQLDSPVPIFFVGCGYRAEPRNAEKLRTSLESLGLAPETLQKLKKDLQLEDQQAGSQ